MRVSLLPDELVQALGEIGERLQAGTSVQEQLATALQLLESLPPHLAIIAGGQIAEAARLYHRQPDNGILALFTRRLSDKEQLLRCRGLEKLFIFHFDGRMREAALQRITGPIASPFLFVAITWRLNDWAKEVRTAAKECANRTFGQSSPSVIAQAAKILMLREHSWRRWGEERGLVWNYFGRSDVTEALADDLIAARQGPTVRVLRQALKQSSIDAHLVRIAESALQPGARAAAFQTLLDRRAKWPTCWERCWIDKAMGRWINRIKYESRPISKAAAPERRALIEMGLKDHSAMVRRMAAQALIDWNEEVPDASHLASTILNDKSPAVRERAAFLLRDDAA